MIKNTHGHCSVTRNRQTTVTSIRGQMEEQSVVCPHSGILRSRHGKEVATPAGHGRASYARADTARCHLREAPRTGKFPGTRSGTGVAEDWEGRPRGERLFTRGRAPPWEDEKVLQVTVVTATQ